MARQERVDSERDVERELDERNVDGVGDVRGRGGRRQREIAAVRESALLGLDADAAPGQLAMDYTALDIVLGNLVRRRQEVAELAKMAAHLTRKMNDGHGPISHAMQVTFNRRADQGEGVAKALGQYGAQLDNLIDALTRSRNLYARIDSDAAKHLQASGGSNA